MNTNMIFAPAVLFAGLFATQASAHEPVVVTAAVPGFTVIIGTPPPPPQVVVYEPAPPPVTRYVYVDAPPPPRRVVYVRERQREVVYHRGTEVIVVDDRCDGRGKGHHKHHDDDDDDDDRVKHVKHGNGHHGGRHRT